LPKQKCCKQESNKLPVTVRLLPVVKERRLIIHGEAGHGLHYCISIACSAERNLRHRGTAALVIVFECLDSGRVSCNDCYHMKSECSVEMSPSAISVDVGARSCASIDRPFAPTRSSDCQRVATVPVPSCVWNVERAIPV